MCRVLRAWVSITGTALIKSKRIIECQGNLLGCPIGPRWGFEARGTGWVSVVERRALRCSIRIGLARLGKESPDPWTTADKMQRRTKGKGQREE